MDDVTVDLGELTLHQARVTQWALQNAMNTGAFIMRANYTAALEVSAYLEYWIAKAEKTPMRRAVNEITLEDVL